jgi:hypothetical protein
MGKKTLTNAHCLLELVERVPASVLKLFAGLPECLGLQRGFDWTQPDEGLSAALIEHIKHLRKEQRDPAEREALRVLRLSTVRGAAILATVAEQLYDEDLLARFRAQEGGEVGRAVWMRTHSEASIKLFDTAESIVNTQDLKGLKRLHDAFDVPGEAPPFLWNDAVKDRLEAQLTEAMRLAEPCEVIHVAVEEPDRQGQTQTTHYLVVRFAGDQVAAVEMRNRQRKSFFYFPARDATLIYAPHRGLVEVFAPTLGTRAPLANVLSRHGFKAPLSNRPLDRSRYDLSRFARPLKDTKPRIDGGRIERLYLTEAKALLGHATDAVTLHIDSGAELHEVIRAAWCLARCDPGGRTGVRGGDGGHPAGHRAGRARSLQPGWRERPTPAPRRDATARGPGGAQTAAPGLRAGRSEPDRAGGPASGERQQPDGRLRTA